MYTYISMYSLVKKTFTSKYVRRPIVIVKTTLVFLQLSQKKNKTICKNEI